MYTDTAGLFGAAVGSVPSPGTAVGTPPSPAGAAVSPTGTLMGAAVGTADDSSPGATVSSFGGGQHCAWATAAASGHFSAEIRYPNSASCRPEQVRESPKPSRRRYSHTSRNKSH